MEKEGRKNLGKVIKKKELKINEEEKKGRKNVGKMIKNGGMENKCRRKENESRRNYKKNEGMKNK